MSNSEPRIMKLIRLFEQDLSDRAYEAGFSKGQICSPDENPYLEGGFENEQWEAGYQHGIGGEIARFRVLPYDKFGNTR